MAEGLRYSLHRYGTHELQRLGVWEFDGRDEDEGEGERYWIVFIHGGAWRDPRVDHEVFATPCINRILSSPSLITSPHTTTSTQGYERLPSDDEDESQTTTEKKIEKGDSTPQPSSLKPPKQEAEEEVPENEIAEKNMKEKKIKIAGFASLDYRLSPHPLFPQDPATTPVNAYRGAMHPDHVDDVRAALGYLHSREGKKGGLGYILVGHSAGGALAFQVLGRVGASDDENKSETEKEDEKENKKEKEKEEDRGKLPPPKAIISISGLHDFRAINARRGNDAYAPFFRAAFGRDETDWDAAAPVKYAGNFDFISSSESGSGSGSGGGGGLVILASSPDDTLVDVPEVEGMAERLMDVDGFVLEEEERADAETEEGDKEEEEEEEKGPAEEGKRNRLVVVKDLQGDHDDIWRDGEGVARLVRIALRKLGGASGQV
ncbi:alpha/beta-hydrolase [Xylariaceae sp. FL0594]|nr:alpha/beta-hydrolase [Xylariaceae sp. FL0594]